MTHKLTPRTVRCSPQDAISGESEWIAPSCGMRHVAFADGDRNQRRAAERIGDAEVQLDFPQHGRNRSEALVLNRLLLAGGAKQMAGAVEDGNRDPVVHLGIL